MISAMLQIEPSPGAGNALVPQEIHYKSQYIIISPGQPALFPITPGPMMIKEGGKMTTPPPILEAAYYPPTTPYPPPASPPLTNMPSNLPKRHTADSHHISNQVSSCFYSATPFIYNSTSGVVHG